MSLEERPATGRGRTRRWWVAPDVLVGWAVAATVAALVTLEVASPLRTALAAPTAFFLPGYLLVAALYPARAATAAEGGRPAGPGAVVDGHLGGVDLRERAALSFGCSLALLPLLGVGIGLSPWSFSTGVAVRAFLGLVLALGLVATLRRRRVAPADRLRVPVGAWAGEARAALRDGPGRSRVLNAALLGAILLALGTVGYALAVPPAGQQFTDFAVLTESDGELVAGQYPDELAPGESATLVAAVENRREDPTAYTVVVTAAPRVDGTLGEETELRRFEETVAPGERWTREHEVSPTASGERVRFSYYLYRGDAPAEPDAAGALHDLHVWTDVADGGPG